MKEEEQRALAPLKATNHHQLFQLKIFLPLPDILGQLFTQSLAAVQQNLFINYLKFS